MPAVIGSPVPIPGAASFSDYPPCRLACGHGKRPDLLRWPGDRAGELTMPGSPPDGEPVPPDGRLEPAALAQLGAAPLGFYVHVPFCATRCGYCDFNTYTAAELGGGASRASYARLAIDEVRLARKVLGAGAPEVSTVFFGGGTPTLLPPSDLAAILAAIKTEFGMATDAEVTTEANPESVDQRALEDLRAGGFTRISLGMQSAAEHVLRVLDRS